MVVMTIKKRSSKPDWGSIKKYVAGQIVGQRKWVERKLTAERELRLKQCGLLDDRLDKMSNDIVEAAASVSGLATHVDDRFDEIGQSSE